MKHLLLILPCLAALHAAEPPPAEEDPAARLDRAQAWSVEKDPARRRELAGEVVCAAIHLYPPDHADEDAIEKKKRAAIEEVAGDATDGRAMLFATDDRRVLTVAPDFRIVKTARYLLGDRALAPRELHPDLALGLFADGQRLVVAGWPGDKGKASKK